MVSGFLRAKVIFRLVLRLNDAGITIDVTKRRPLLQLHSGQLVRLKITFPAIFRGHQRLATFASPGPVELRTMKNVSNFACQSVLVLSLMLLATHLGCGGSTVRNVNSTDGENSAALTAKVTDAGPSRASASKLKSSSQVEALPDSPLGLAGDRSISSSLLGKAEPTTLSTGKKSAANPNAFPEVSQQEAGVSNQGRSESNMPEGVDKSDRVDPGSQVFEGRPSDSSGKSNDAAPLVDDKLDSLSAVTTDRFGIPSVKTTNDGYKPQRKLGPGNIVSVDWERCQAAGLRYVQTRHFTLITDHPADPIIDDFGKVFEQAVPQWIEFFSADARRFRDWHVTCFLIVDIEKFKVAQLLPPANLLPGGRLPPGGWEYGNQIWVNRHPGTYYNRHMLLHEGTHAFCYYNFGTLGPIWLAEGLAEHLALHRWNDGKLEMAARVVDKNELAYWGRVKLIQDAYRTGIPKSFQEVMALPISAFPQTEAYAWSWAAVNMLDTHPMLKSEFRTALKGLGTNRPDSISRSLLHESSLNVEQLEAQWQVMTKEMQYGYDLQRSAIQWKEAKALTTASQSLKVPADGAWHSTGLNLPTGRWKIQSKGSFQIAKEGNNAWISEPEGITIAYVHGQPLGQLQYALVGRKAFFQGMTELSNAQPAGELVEFPASGEELFLRINDLPNRLDDNQGEVEVVIQKVTSEP